jgi:hypothetical protein
MALTSAARNALERSLRYWMCLEFVDDRPEVELTRHRRRRAKE